MINATATPNDTFNAALTAALWLWFGGWASALAVVDIREHRLPNRMVAIAFLGCVLITGLQAAVTGELETLVRSGLASMLAIAVFALVHVLGGMGMGDVKYAGVTGWALGTIGWSAVWWGHVLGFVTAGVVVVVAMIFSRLHRRAAVPFGPFMGVGAVVVGIAAIAPTGMPA